MNIHELVEIIFCYFFKRDRSANTRIVYKKVKFIRTLFAYQCPGYRL
jgi:hypothetical protein